jgi:carbon storage regulator
MLVLTRRPNESIIIANNIKITVVSVGPGRVKLGIEAPPSVRVDRKEIHDKIEQSADVLATVGGSTAASDQQSTLVGHSGPDTTLIVPAGVEVVVDTNTDPSANTASTTSGEPPLPLNKLSKFRPPRKPR